MFIRRFRRRSGYKLSPFIKILIFAAAVFLIFNFVFEAATKNIQNNIIENRALILAESSINSAVSDYISENGVDGSEFITLSFGNNGTVEAVTENAMAVNAFKSKVDLAIQSELEKLHTETVKVPIGAFSGMALLSSSGPEIDFTYYITASFKSKINSYFTDSGINQTLHHIELDVDALCTLTCFGHDEQIPFSTNFDIAQTVIAGDVPNTYFHDVEAVDFY